MAEFYTATEFMKIINCSKPTILKLLKNKQLKGIKVGKNWRIPKSELERMQRGE